MKNETQCPTCKLLNAIVAENGRSVDLLDKHLQVANRHFYLMFLAFIVLLIAWILTALRLYYVALDANSSTQQSLLPRQALILPNLRPVTSNWLFDDSLSFSLSSRVCTRPTQGFLLIADCHSQSQFFVRLNQAMFPLRYPTLPSTDVPVQSAGYSATCHLST